MHIELKRTRVVLARPHDMMRDGIVALLDKTDGIDLIASTGDAERCITMIREHRPHVVIVNTLLPHINGIDLAHSILASSPAPGIVLLGTEQPGKMVFDAIKTNIFSYVLQRDGFDELLRAIRAARARRTYLSLHAVGLFADNYRALARGGMDRDCPALTRRQRQILQLFAEGMTTKQIASHLSVSSKTVASYREQIMSKLQMRGIADLTRYAIRNGIIPAE